MRVGAAARRRLAVEAVTACLPVSGGYPLPPLRHGRGCSSVVERNLAKVDVEGSSPFSRSTFRLREVALAAVSLQVRANLAALSS